MFLNGSAKKDACGVCGGDDSSCKEPEPCTAADKCVGCKSYQYKRVIWVSLTNGDPPYQCAKGGESGGCFYENQPCSTRIGGKIVF